MTGELFVGIDIGTTSAKAIICDANGRILAQASQEYATTFPRANWAEQAPDDWWRATCIVVAQILAESEADPVSVAAVGVSSQAPSVVAVDRQGHPVHPALIWMDRRSETQCQALRGSVLEDEIARINGGRIDPYYLAPKLLWMRDEAPNAYAQCHQVLQANGYIVHQLTGVFCMDSSHGPLSLLFDSARQQWSTVLVDDLGLDYAKLPRIIPCRDVAGAVTAAAALATGLAPGTPVIAGMVDGAAAGIEVGLVRPGDAAEMTGQSTVLLICNDRPYRGKDLIPIGHPVPGLYFVAGAMVASGGALRWFRDQLGELECAEARRLGVDPFELLGRLATQSPAGANRLLFLPYMYGERSPIWDTNARGVFFGLSLATQKSDLVRAIMEGAAYGLRHNVDAAAEAGFNVSKLACVGGGARSALWNQIKADVLNRPIYLPDVASGAPMGDAIVAAVGVGLYATVQDAVIHMTGTGPYFEPQEKNESLYDALYHVYRGLYPALRTSFRELADVPL
jgi:xylulokinase